MPRIPYGISEADLPSTGGLRGGMVPIPATQEPGVDINTAAAPGRALAGVGEQVAQAGQFVVQAEQYASQKQHAQNVLDATLGEQYFQQRFQQKMSELQQGDYRTLPEDVQRAGQQIAVDISAEMKMNAQTQQLFKIKAMQHITIGQNHALGIQTQRRQQDTIYATTNAVQQAQQDAMAATTDDERYFAMDRLRSNLQGMVSAGLMQGKAAAELEHGTKLVVQKDRALVAIRANPMGSYNELQALAQAADEGRTMQANTPAFRGLPLDLLSPLLDDAARHMHQAATLRDQQERYTQQRVTQLQGELEGNLFRDTHSILPTPENVPLIQAQQERIHEAWGKKQLTREGYERQLKDNQAWLEKARHPVREDDQTIVDSLNMRLFMASSHEDFMDFRAHVTDNLTSLKSTTAQTLMTTAESRENSLHYSNRPSWRTGRDLIVQSLFPGPAGIGPMAGQYATVEEKNRANNALQVYDARTANLSPREVDEQARTIAQEVIRDFVSQPVTAKAQLPQPLLTLGTGPEGLAKDDREAHDILYSQVNLPPEQANRMYKAYTAWRRTPEAINILGPVVQPLERGVQPAPATPRTGTRPSTTTPRSNAGTTRYGP